MDAGLMIRWGSARAGREDQAIALFDVALTYYSSLVQGGQLTNFEPFFLTTADLEDEQGFFILRGPAEGVQATMDSEEHKTLLIKAGLVLHHLRVSMLTVGDGVLMEMERYNKARAEMHL